MLIQQIAVDDEKLRDLFVTRVSLSANRGSCTIFLAMMEPNEEKLQEKLRHLVLYKPSLRTSLAKASHARGVPMLFFKIDDQIKKQHRIDQLFDELKNNGQL